METTRSVTFLEGMTVLELGPGIGGAYAGSVLASLGATVVTLDEGRTDPAFRLLDRLKISAARASVNLERLLGELHPDVVVCDRVSGPALGLPADLEGYLDAVARLNPAVWVTLSAFGLDGPDGELFGTDFTISAASGISAYVRRGETGRSLLLPGRQGLLAGGQSAVLAAMHGVDLALQRQAPVHMDTSAQEAAIATGPMLQAAERLLSIKIGGTGRFGAPFGSYPCTDGFVYVGAAEDHQWRGVVNAIDAPAWAVALEDAESRSENKDRIDTLVAGWAAHQQKRAAQDVLQGNGVPAGESNSREELLNSPQFDFRNAWTAVGGGIDTPIMDSPFLTRMGSSEPGPRDGGEVGGVRSLRILEATHILSGSVAGALLGAMGADVVKVEDPDRLDLYRRQGPFINGERHVDRSGYFSISNHSKRSHVLRDKADLATLVGQADVVLENWGAGRASREGLDSATIAERHPQKLAVSISGFGHSGPYRNYRVYAYILNAYCGIAEALRSPTGAAASLDFAWADFTSAYSAATVISAWAVGRSRGNTAGAAVDLSMAEVLVERMNLVTSSEPVGRTCDEIYALGENGTPIAVSTATPIDGAVLGRLGLVPVGERRAIPAGGVAEPAAPAEVRRVLAELRADGALAAPVHDAEGMIADAHIAHRSFFAELDGPEWEGLRIIGLPWREAGQGAVRLAAPPRLGSHGPAEFGVSSEPMAAGGTRS